MTTNILGDIVSSLVGHAADVVVILPPGADPHDFQPSAQDVAAMSDADVLIMNGGGFEHGLVDVVETVEGDGVTVHAAIDSVDVIGDDPHFFTDPARMVTAARALVDVLVEVVPDLDRAAAEATVGSLEELDAEVESILAAVPVGERVLVTNHEVFAYFADRYGFDIVGTVIPGSTTADSASAGELAELADLIRDRGVPAIFADTSAPDELARTLAEEVGDVEVVPLFSESLDPADPAAATYAAMMRTNATRIAEALAG